MRLPNKLNNLTAFTLVEVLIVVGIMGVLTVAALPSFGDFADRKTFQNNVDIFAENVRSTRSKAIDGVVVSGKNVNWKITATNNSSSYVIGYVPSDGSAAGNSKTVTLSGVGSTFSCTVCEIRFERLTGKRISGTAGLSQDIIINFNGTSKTIKIYETGKIVIQ